MKKLRLVIVFMIISLLAGCALTSKYGKLAKSIEGTWQEIGGATYTIELQKRTPVMTAITDSDGENFEIRESNWQDGVLSWIYFVPSTSYIVYMQTTSITATKINCTWFNDYSDGTEILYKVIE